MMQTNVSNTDNVPALVTTLPICIPVISLFAVLISLCPNAQDKSHQKKPGQNTEVSKSYQGNLLDCFQITAETHVSK